MKIITFLVVNLACCISYYYLNISLKQINGLGAYHLIIYDTN